MAGALVAPIIHELRDRGSDRVVADVVRDDEGPGQALLDHGFVRVRSVDFLGLEL